jgi:hypothetical protein
MGRRWIFPAWLLTGAIVCLTVVWDARALEVVAGLLLVGWGLLISTNYRGAADAMPSRFGFGPLWQETSRAMTRVIFGFFGLVGLLLVTGVLRSS